MKVIYKITYPNGKIYIGKDSTGDNLRYFGSPDREYLEKDFCWEDQLKINIIKEILFYSENISETDLCNKESEIIVQYGSNIPEKGYNILPRYK